MVKYIMSILTNLDALPNLNKPLVNDSIVPNNPSHKFAYYKARSISAQILGNADAIPFSNSPLAIQNKVVVKESFDQIEAKNLEPKEWYSFYLNENGEVSIKLPKDIANEKNVIYVFKYKVDGKLLIGKTHQQLSKRLNKYLFNIKYSNKKSSFFYQDIKSNPDMFSFGILYKLKPEENIDQVERACIIQKRNVVELYNENDGGGGGVAHSVHAASRVLIPDPKKMPKILTPRKYYPVEKDEETGRIRVKFSPGLYKELKERRKQKRSRQPELYKAVNIENGMVYVGSSVDLPRRTGEHTRAAEFHDPDNAKFDPSKKGGEFRKALGQTPENFKIGLLRPLLMTPPKTRNCENAFIVANTPAEAEKACIEVYDCVFPKGYNMNAGGGGPLPRQEMID